MKNKINQYKRCGAGVLVGLMLMLAGCNRAPETVSTGQTEAFQFVDDLGEEISLDAPGQVVVCTGSLAEIWHLAGGQLGGVTQIGRAHV